MPDAPDPDAPQDSSRSDDDRDWYVQQWNALCEELGTSNPNKVLARVQTLKRQMEQRGEQDPGEEGLVTISEVEEVFREMNQKIEKLRERNASLAEELEAGEDEGSLGDLHQKLEQLLDTLGVATVDEAQDRVQQLNELLETLYREKETLVQADLSDAEEALGAIERLREERDALRRERDQLAEELAEATTQGDPSSSPDPDTSALEAVAVRDRLGVSSPHEAEALAQAVADVHERVRSRAAAHGVEPEDTPDGVLERLRGAAAQLEALPAPADETLSAEVGDMLGVRTVEDARELRERMDEMSAQLERLRDEHEALDEAGLSAEGALAMIENMEAQLEDLYHHADRDDAGSGGDGGRAVLDDALLHRITSLTDASPEAADDLSELVRPLVDQLDALRHEEETCSEAGGRAAADRLAAIEEVLGISTRQEAEELSQIAHHMEEQLTTLYREKEKLRELGLSSVEDAVDMIKSMEAQLDDLYTGRDAELDPEERHEARLWAPGDDSLAGEEPADGAAPPADAEDAGRVDTETLAMSSMEYQLEALYREKELLLRQGLGSAEEAVTRLQTQQRRINALQRENYTYEQRFDRLKSELGTEQVPQIVELVRELETAAEVSLDEVRPDPATDAPEPSEYGVNVAATSPLVEEETLDRLDEMSTEELDALDVGVLRLRDDGTVEALNETALRLPGLRGVDDRSGVVGENFFLDLAPSTNNTLFFGRFQEGQRRGTLDARFPYTFLSPEEEAQSFAVHLYRAPESDATWLLFRPA